MAIFFRNLLTVVFVSVSFSCWSQDFSQNWTSHFAYLNFADIAYSEEGRVYIASNNSLFVHNTENDTNTQYTTVEGVLAETISTIHYSKRRKLIVVGFQNGLIQIINEITGEILTIVDIQDQLGLPVVSIKINDFTEDEDFLYIGTGFGVVAYNLNTNTFGDTFFISNNSSITSDVISVSVFGDFLFASILGRGTFIGNKRDFNLVQFSNWTQIQADVFNDIETFSGQLIAYRNSSLYLYNGTTFVSNFPNSSTILDLQINNNNITITYTDKALELNRNFNVQRTTSFPSDFNVTNSIYIGNEIYYTNTEKGFFKSVVGNFSNPEKISPEGPERNDAFAIDAYNGDLWVVYGRTSVSFNAFPLRSAGLSRLRNRNWFTIPFEDFNLKSITSVAIDKTNKEKVYFSSYSEGLLEYSQGNMTVFDETNSNINKDFQFSDDTNPELNTSRVFASTFNSNNELWIINSRTNNPLKKFIKNTNSDGSVDISSSISSTTFRVDNLNFWDIEITDNNNVFAANFREGLLAYNDTTKRSLLIKDKELNNIPERVRTIAVDLNEELWVGTDKGLRKFTNPNSIFTDNVPVAESIIIDDRGEAQELLFEQGITDIEVDANNNKWIGTVSAGIFFVSPNGEETFNIFNQDNSPLPSNGITDITIDNVTGQVFIATNRGLMEYNGDAVLATENFDEFKIIPNPVRPEYGEIDVKIEGLTPGANVKITDIEGNLVYESQNKTFNGSGSGRILWDTRSFSGNKVASGVYLILITSEDQSQTKVGKLLIVR